MSRATRDRRRGGVLVALLAGLFLAAVAGAAPASAHAEVVSSDPGDSARLTSVPGAVSVRFSEPVRLDIGYLRVVDGGGARVDTGTPEHPGGDQSAVSVGLRPGLGDGSYVVSFRVESADSHPVAGAYSFVVGDGPLASLNGAVGSAGGGAPVDGAVDLLFGVTRWAGFAGLTLFVGGAAFLVLAWPEGRAERRSRRLVWTGWAVTAATAVLSLFLQSLYASGQGLGRILDTDLLDTTLHTDYGRMLSVRLMLLAALALLLDHVFDSQPREDGERGWQVDAAALVSLGVFATVAVSGHAATGIQPPVAVLSDTVHLAAMATWLGGIVMLAACLLPTRRTGELARVLPVFSRIAVVSVGALVVTGLYQTWREVGTPPALWSTGYGRLLLAKVASFLLLVSLGYLSHTAVRRGYVLPAVRALAATPAAPPVAAVIEEPPPEPELARDEGPLLSRLRRSVGVEIVIATAVLALTAVLITQAPGRQTYTAPYDDTLALPGGGSVQLQVTPARRGGNDVHLYVFGADGRPARPREVSVTATLPGRHIGPLAVSLHGAGAGHYIGSALSLPDSGRWQVRIAVRTSEFDQPTATATVTVR